MMQSDSGQRAYTLVDPRWVQTRIFSKTARQTPLCVAELREIAPIGAKVLVEGLPRIEYECMLSLESSRLEHAIVIAAHMQWARPNPAGDWLLGCAFDRPLEKESLDALIHSGLLERRSAVRRPTRIAVDAQLQVGKGRIPALVCDLSEGGLCLTISTVPENKHDLHIFACLAGEEICIPLQRRWSMHVGPNYFMGCEFIRRSDFAVLRKLHPARQDHFRVPAPPSTAAIGGDRA